MTTAVPLANRSYEGTMGLVQPTGMPGGIEGPFTTWYADGTLASHGSYSNYGARSVPDGLWTFWYPDGRRRLLGQYHRGQPQGCFAVWTESGQRKTGVVQGDELRVDGCTPPSDEEVLAIEQGGRVSRPSTTWADFHLLGMAGPNHIGAANPVQVSQDPGMTLAISVAARKHVGSVRVGPIVGARIANESGYLGLVMGGTAALRLPTFHPRIDMEVAAEVAAQRISVSSAQRRMQPGTASSLAFWSALPALQLNLAVAMSPNIEAMVGARVDGLPARDVERDVIYCDRACFAPVRETWSIGGIAYGVVFGLRLLVQ